MSVPTAHDTACLPRCDWCECPCHDDDQWAQPQPVDGDDA